MDISLEDQLINGTLSPEQYLLLLGKESPEGRAYWIKVHAILTADYKDYHTNLYKELIDQIANVVNAIQISSYSRGRNARLRKFFISQAIESVYDLLKEGLANGTIRLKTRGG
jgi:hypothetical protein